VEVKTTARTWSEGENIYRRGLERHPGSKPRCNFLSHNGPASWAFHGAYRGHMKLGSHSRYMLDNENDGRVATKREQ